MIVPEKQARAIQIGGGLTCLIPFVAYYWFVWRFGVNVPFLDDWTGIVQPLIRVSWGSYLWGQHNESRLVLPNVMFFLLARASRLNLKWDMYLSAMLLGSSVVVLYLRFRDHIRSTWVFAPVSFLMFSWLQWGNALWAFQLAWYITLFLSLTSLLFLSRHKSRFGIWLAILFAVLASYSSLQGFLVWPVGLFTLWFYVRTTIANKRLSGLLVLWLMSGVFTIALFLNGYRFQFARGSSVVTLLAHPIKDLLFFLTSLGGVWPSMGSANGVLGVFVIICIVAVLRMYVLMEPSTKTAFVPSVELILLGLGFQILILLGRSGVGLDKALTPGYTLYYLLQFCGLYLFLSTGDVTAKRAHARILRGIIIVIGVIQVPLATMSGLQHGQLHYVFMRGVRHELIFDVGAHDVTSATMHFVAPYTFPGGEKPLVHDVAFLHRKRLSLFARPYTPSVLKSYECLVHEHPHSGTALVSVFDLYLLRQDLQAAFPIGRLFPSDLLKWAAAASDTMPQLEPYSASLRQLTVRDRC